MRTLFAAVLLAAAPLSAAAAQPPAPTAEVSEALIQRLIASFPDQEQLSAGEGIADANLLGRLEAVNPGRGERIRSILIENSRCTAPVYRAGVVAMFRATAQRLGTAKVERLIVFYEGPDFPRFRDLVERSQRGEALTGPEQAEIGRIAAAYPLEDFYTAFQAVAPPEGLDPTGLDGLRRCANALRERLSREGLRLD
jgi:hypothetical protein